MKECIKCKQERIPHYFQFSPHGDGRKAVCKFCEAFDRRQRNWRRMAKLGNPSTKKTKADLLDANAKLREELIYVKAKLEKYQRREVRHAAAAQN